MTHTPLPPLEPQWTLVDGLPVYHRICTDAGPDAAALVHVHGFGISGTYLEPTAALLADRYRTYVPDLPGMGRSIRPPRPLDLPGLASALMSYCTEVGVEKATLVGNSLGCPIILEVARSYPERIAGAVLVSPAGGPNNQPLARALGQMAIDGLREPFALATIAVRDYMRFGLVQGLMLFRAMTRYPTIESLRNLVVPTLVIAGDRDPLVRIERVHIFADLPQVTAVKVPGAHALNFSEPQRIASLIDAHLTGRPLPGTTGPDPEVEILEISGPAPPSGRPRRRRSRR